MPPLLRPSLVHRHRPSSLAFQVDSIAKESRFEATSIFRVARWFSSILSHPRYPDLNKKECPGLTFDADVTASFLVSFHGVENARCTRAFVREKRRTQLADRRKDAMGMENRE